MYRTPEGSGQDLGSLVGLHAAQPVCGISARPTLSYVPLLGVLYFLYYLFIVPWKARIRTFGFAHLAAAAAGPDEGLVMRHTEDY